MECCTCHQHEEQYVNEYMSCLFFSQRDFFNFFFHFFFFDSLFFLVCAINKLIILFLYMIVFYGGWFLQCFVKPRPSILMFLNGMSHV